MNPEQIADIVGNVCIIALFAIFAWATYKAYERGYEVGYRRGFSDVWDAPKFREFVRSVDWEMMHKSSNNNE